MSKTNKSLLQFLIAGLILLFFVAPALTRGRPTLAEETVPIDPAVVVAETEVTPEELGVSESALLPGSTFYFLKEWGWKIQEALATDDAKKTELVQKHVNQRLFDLQQALEKNIITAAEKNKLEAMEMMKHKAIEVDEFDQDFFKLT